MRNCYQSGGCASAYHDHMMQTDSGRSASADCECYLAIATVPWQHFTNSYDPERALQAGTMFPELDKPFLGRRLKA